MTSVEGRVGGSRPADIVALAARLVRLVSADDEPGHLIPREPVVEIAMELKNIAEPTEMLPPEGSRWGGETLHLESGVIIDPLDEHGFVYVADPDNDQRLAVTSEVMLGLRAVLDRAPADRLEQWDRAFTKPSENREPQR